MKWNVWIDNFYSRFFGLFLISVQTWAGNVALKNGNYVVGNRDIRYSGGFQTEFKRVYNSKTPFKGILGWGWGNEFETYLNVSADGSVVVHEYGGGAENRFIPLAYSENELNKAVEDLAGVAQKMGAVGSGSQLVAYKDKLKKDASFRNDEWEKFKALGKIAGRAVPVGEQLKSVRFSYQYITKLKDGYQRVTDAGRIEEFDELGRLRKVADKSGGNFIAITRKGTTIQVVDNSNRKMILNLNSKGLLERIDGENGKKVAYKYSNKDELIKATDSSNKTYGYTYDKNGRHNLVRIDYDDKTFESIEYYPMAELESVKSVKERDGTSDLYEYKREKDRYAVSTKIKGPDNKLVSDSKYEYYTARKSDGEEWTKRLVSTVDGEVTDTVYNEKCALPEKIAKGGQSTTFEYDPKCHVVKKVSPSEVDDLAYDNAVGKVSSVVVTMIENGKEVSKSSANFTYDKDGDLLTASNSAGKSEKLIYDKQKRISAMVDEKRSEIRFKYSSDNKPIEITDPKVGSVMVSYTNSGDIKSVSSPAGRKIASLVTQKFQQLLDIIRPAGVTLAF
jgi:YD repeat-containing protein